MKKQKGFSLVELIVTMALAAIVIAVGVPSFQSTMQDNRQTTAINELSSALNFARSSAITRRERVTVCKSPNGLNCIADGAASDWSQGWMVFADPNNSNTRELGEEILHVHSAVRGNITISGNLTVVDRVAFQPQGILVGVPGTITYCDPLRASHATGLVLSKGGQIRFEDDGSKLTC